LYLCHGRFRASNVAFEKHILKCEHRLVYKPSDFWSRITTPKTGGLLQFNSRNAVRAKFVIYSDFESTTCPDGRQRVNSYCLFCPDLFDLGSSCALMMHCNKDEEEVIKNFCRDLQIMYDLAFNYLEQHKEVPKLTKEQQKEFDKADKHLV
jgi:hypothetical protein